MLHLRYWLLFLVVASTFSTPQVSNSTQYGKMCPIPKQTNPDGWERTKEPCPKENHSCMAILHGEKFQDGGCIISESNTFYHPNKTRYINVFLLKENPCKEGKTGVHTLGSDVDGTMQVKVCCDKKCLPDPFSWKDQFHNLWLACVGGVLGGLISFGYTLSFTHMGYVKCRAKKVVLKAKKRKSRKSKNRKP